MTDTGIAPTLERDVLIVDGMFCASCAAAVEAVLRRQPGVRAAQTHFAADAAVVEWDAQTTSLDRLRAAVAQVGYTTRRLSDPTDRGARPPLHLGSRLAVAVFCAMWSMFALVGLYFGSPQPAVAAWLALASGVVAIPALTWSGWPFYVAGWRTLRAGVPGVDSLILLGVTGAVVLSVASLWAGRDEVYFDTAVVLVTLQLLGRLIDTRVRSEAAQRVRSLLAIDTAAMTRILPGDKTERVACDSLRPDDPVLVALGDAVSADLIIDQGALWVDRSRLTGESEAVHCRVGDVLWAGDRVTGGQARCRVTALPGKRRIDALATQVRRVLTQKPAWQARVDHLARYVLPVAALAAVIAALMAILQGHSGFDSATRALAVFVIACPCALSLAVPLAMTRAMDVAARHGAVIRDSDVVQHYRAPDILLLDKTGTLTEGRPRVAHTRCAPGITTAHLQRCAGVLAAGSQHPLARAVVAHIPPAAPPAGGQIQEVPGRGVIYRDDDTTLRMGSRAWLRGFGIDVPVMPARDTEIHVTENGTWLGAMMVRDTLRPGVTEAIAALVQDGLRVEILSGDRSEVVDALGTALGLPGRGACTPEDKLAYVETLRGRGFRVAYCGDGINDGPALAAADLGIAVERAAGAAQSAAAVSLESGGIERLRELLGLFAKARRVSSQNLVFAVAYNLLALPLAMAGWVHPLIAAAAMGLSTLTMLGNSTRIRHASRYPPPGRP